jgi:hypothetical protein
MTTDLDRLELELRSVPGTVAVGLDGDAEDQGLLIQAVVVSSMAPPDVRDRIQRIIEANVADAARVEIVIDEVDGPAE